VDDATLSQLVDHGYHGRQLLTVCVAISRSFQVTNGITGSFAIVTVTIATLGSLSGIFFGSLMVCHVLIFQDGKGKGKSHIGKILC
jgi:hypothetical protein